MVSGGSIQHLDASQDSVDELASRIVQSLTNLQVGRHEPASAPEAHSSRHLPKEEKVEHNRQNSFIAGWSGVGGDDLVDDGSQCTCARQCFQLSRGCVEQGGRGDAI